MHIRSTAILTLTLAAALTAPAAAQNGRMDQSGPFLGERFGVSNPNNVWQQQVRVGIPGLLEGFRISLHGPVGAEATLRIRVGPGWNTGPVAFETQVRKETSNQEFFFIDATPANLIFAANETFVIEAQGNNTGASIEGSWCHDGSSPWYHQPFFFNGNPIWDGDRLGFQTWMLDPPGFTLEVGGACPGTVSVEWSGTTPSRPMGIVFARNQGAVVIPSGPCIGTQLGLGSNQLQLVNQIGSGANGSGQVQGSAGQGACGGFLQLVVADDSPCTTSNVAQIP